MTLSIGDRVTLKKTGIITVATVIGIIDSERFNKMTLARNKARWDELYPDWEQKAIVYLEYDQPQRPVSYEEYCGFHQENPEFQKLDEDMKVFNYDRIPVEYFVCTPIDDVELI